jgi:hypothetical protein
VPNHLGEHEKNELLRFRSDGGLDRMTLSHAKIRARSATGFLASLVNLAMHRDVTVRVDARKLQRVGD